MRRVSHHRLPLPPFRDPRVPDDAGVRLDDAPPGDRLPCIRTLRRSCRPPAAYSCSRRLTRTSPSIVRPPERRSRSRRLRARPGTGRPRSRLGVACENDNSRRLAGVATTRRPIPCVLRVLRIYMRAPLRNGLARSSKPCLPEWGAGRAGRARRGAGSPGPPERWRGATWLPHATWVRPRRSAGRRWPGASCWHCASR